MESLKLQLQKFLSLIWEMFNNHILHLEPSSLVYATVSICVYEKLKFGNLSFLPNSIDSKMIIMVFT